MNSEAVKILLVDDESDVLDFLSYNLKKEGYHVLLADNGEEAIEIANAELPQLILMDVMMPKMDGIQACKEIRKNRKLKTCLIAFLTARGEEIAEIEGFEVGADDYITKPIKPKVLISRIKGLLRRLDPSNMKLIEKFGELLIDREQFIVKKSNKKIILPKMEFSLLELLTSKPGKVFTRKEIFNEIWGNDVIVGDRTIDVHIRKLREKIGGHYIRTVKGIGYKFEN